MRSVFSRIFLPLSIVLLTVMSCSTGKKATRSNGALPPRARLTATEQLHFNLLYHEALICLEREQYDAHMVLLERALEIDSTASEALWPLARAQYMFATRRDSAQRQLAVKNMKRAAYYNPNDVDILENLAIMFDYEGRYEEALKCYEQIAEQRPTKSAQIQLAESYRNLKRFDKALGVYNQMERQSGRTREVIWGKLYALRDGNDSLQLFAFLDTIINEHPNAYEYQIFKGELYAHQYHCPDSAVAIYKGVLLQSPQNKQAQYALVKHYAAVEDRDNFYASIKTLVNNKHIEEHVRKEILDNYIRYCLTEDSLRLSSIRQFLDEMEFDENATGQISASHVALLIYLNADPDSTLHAINRTLRLHPEYSEVRRQGLSISYSNGYYDEVFRLCEEGQYYDPQELLYYYLPASFYLQDGNTEAALTTLERGEPHYMTHSDDTLASELYALMGDTYHEVGKLERCYACYDSALVLVPDNPQVLNNYAYFLSLEGSDLEKAQVMAHRVCELHPNDPTYLDTYAWVLYQLGQYTQAKIYIDQTLAAVTEEDESSTYYKHAGDIYWKIGDRKNARKFWKRAEELVREGKE